MTRELFATVWRWCMWVIPAQLQKESCKIMIFQVLLTSAERCACKQKSVIEAFNGHKPWQMCCKQCKQSFKHVDVYQEFLIFFLLLDDLWSILWCGSVGPRSGFYKIHSCGRRAPRTDVHGALSLWRNECIHQMIGPNDCSHCLEHIWHGFMTVKRFYDTSLLACTSLRGS